MKTDPVLGAAVHNHLLKLGIETPTTRLLLGDNKSKKDIIAHHVQQIWTQLGLDLADDSLSGTPDRIAKMFVDEIYWGLNPDNFPKMTTITNKMKYDQMLIERNVTVISSCEHHGVTIDGVAHVAYIPKQKVIGLSKINRIVNYFSRRPQVQERLTAQILETLKFVLETDDVAVMVDAVHYCVKSRGIQDQNSSTITSALSGKFLTEPDVRKEFLSIVK